MMERFRPFEGNEPYIFVSYSHAESEIVLKTICALYDAGYRVWYDEGIPAGDDWPLNIETHLRASDTVLFFASENSLSSSNCLSEIRTAFRMGKKILCVESQSLAELLCGPAEETADITLSDLALWRECLASAQLLILSPNTELSETLLRAFSGAEYLQGEYQSVARQRSGRNLVPIIVLGLSILLFAGVTGGTWALLTGRLPQFWSPPAETSEAENEPEPTPVPTLDPSVFAGLIKNNISFPDELQERAVRLATGISEGEISREKLADITSLSLCGTLTAAETSDISYDSGWTVNGVPTVRGNVSDLSLIKTMYALEELSIVNEDLCSIEEFSQLPVLQMLSAAGNPIRSLEGVEGFPVLSSLDISHTEIRNLTPLSALPSLRKVYVSSDMLPLILDHDASYEVILVR